MKKFILLVGLVLVTLTSSNIAPKTWNSIAEKTWFSRNGFAGEQIVFYESVNGLKRAIRQIHGSGVYIVATEIYDVGVTQDTITLTYCPDNQKIRNIKLIYNETNFTLTANSDSLTYKIFSDKPIVYNFDGDFFRGEKIPFEILKSVSIQKGVTFEKGIFKNIKTKIH
jgi:hypothetical protein